MAESELRFLSFLRLCLHETVKTTFDKSDRAATASGIVIGIIVHYIPTWEQAINSILWEIPVACLASVTLTRLLLSPFLVYRKRDSEAEISESKLEQIEKAKPRIVLRQPGAIYVEPVSQNLRSQTGQTVYSHTVPFLKVRFVNDPEGSYPSARADDVRAKIDYYNCADGTHLLSIDGRWAESDQPPAINPLASKSHLLGITFDIGEERSLDIAYRDGETGEYFAWNNDNYNYPFFRYHHHLLVGNHFRADIRLRGPWIDERFSFTFRTAQEGFEI